VCAQATRLLVTSAHVRSRQRISLPMSCHLSWEENVTARQVQILVVVNQRSAHAAFMCLLSMQRRQAPSYNCALICPPPRRKMAASRVCRMSRQSPTPSLTATAHARCPLRPVVRTKSCYRQPQATKSTAMSWWTRVACHLDQCPSVWCFGQTMTAEKWSCCPTTRSLRMMACTNVAWSAATPAWLPLSSPIHRPSGAGRSLFGMVYAYKHLQIQIQTSIC